MWIMLFLHKLSTQPIVNFTGLLQLVKKFQKIWQ